MFDRTSTAGLAVILVTFFVVVQGGWSEASFGYTHDDSLYMSSAQALARGEGYAIPSIPGSPPQTKYPVFYPLLLSLVWRLNPEFPANLELAAGLNALFGCAFLAGSWVLFRQLGVGKWAALGGAALCAFHPILRDLTGMLLSDVPFMALAVWAAVLASTALSIQQFKPAAFWKYWSAATLLAVLAVMTRSIGIALVAGIALAGLKKREYRAVVVLVMVCAGVFLAGMWWAEQARSGEIRGTAPADGFGQTLLFYTSYLGFWRFSVPDVSTFWDQISFNFMELLKAPAALALLLPVAGFADGWWQVIGVAVSAGIVKGVIGSGLARGWHPLHFGLLFYLPVVLIWNYTLMDRFLLLFLPLFLCGAGHEIQGVVTGAMAVFRKAAPWGDRTAGAFLLALLGCLSSYAAYRYVWQVPEVIAQREGQRRSLLSAKLAAYEWIRGHTAPDDRFICYEDASLYLYTGRQALRPIAISTAAFFRQDKSVLDRDLQRLADTADGLNASHWLVSPDDYHLESADLYMREATGELLSGHPVVFAAADGSGLKIHELIRPGLGAE